MEATTVECAVEGVTEGVETGVEVTTGQAKFSMSPLDAAFVTTDYEKFWEVFDRMDSVSGNPFGDYLDNASEGLKPFVGYLDY